MSCYGGLEPLSAAPQSPSARSRETGTMSQAYTPGLQVAERTLYRARRMLPIAGDVLVREGQRVGALDVAARTELPGDVVPINLSNQLGIPASDVPGCMLKQEGDAVEAGEPLARTKGIFGMFRNEYVSKGAGTIESISGVTGQVILRGAPILVEVRAYLAGKVVEVLPREGCIIEAQAAFVQGIFGVGGEAYGPIRMACRSPADEFTPEHIQPDMRGCVVIGGARMHGETVRTAIAAGVSALVSGGIDDEDLKGVLGYDLGVAITGSEQIGLTLIVTEGFGDIAMADRTFRLLSAHAGEAAAVNGATQIRAGVMRPEIVVPQADAAVAGVEQAAHVMAAPLEVGASVRIIRDPYFGVLGRVAALPPEPRVLGSGSKARVLEVATASGEKLIVPRANVEIIGA